MKKAIILGLFTIGFSAQASQLDFCYTGSSAVGAGYKSCVNFNFKKIEDKLGTDLSLCNSLNKHSVSKSFEDCISNNFKKIEYVIPAELKECKLMGSKMNGSYSSCISDNFKNIEKYL